MTRPTVNVKALKPFTSLAYEGAVRKGDTLTVTAARADALEADGRAERVSADGPLSGPTGAKASTSTAKPKAAGAATD